MSVSWQILYIEDDEDDFILLREMLSHTAGQQTTLTWARSYEEGETRLQSEPYDAVLVDYQLGPRTGLELIRQYSSAYPSPFILYTGRGGYDVDLETMQAGAAMYLVKGETNPYSLERFIRYAIERKNVEAELRRVNEQAAWLGRFPDENPNPVARVALDGKILYCNEQAAEPGGWGFSTGKMIPAVFQPLLEEARQYGDRVEADVHLGERYYTVTLMPFAKDGYVNLYGLDISGRVLAEMNLRAATDLLHESEARFRTMADGTPVIIWVTDARGRTEFINQAFNDFFGVTLEQIHAGSWEMLVHPEDTDSYVKVFAECNRMQVPFRAQGRVMRHDGLWRWVDSFGQPRFSEAGEYLGMAGSSVDITEHRKSEEALRRSYTDLAMERNRLVAVMEALPIGVSIIDRQGGMISKNQAFDAIWGDAIPRTESVDDYGAFQAWWAETGEPLKPDEWASAVAVHTGQPVANQFLRIQRFDGKQIFVLNGATPIFDTEETVLGCVVAIMDVTRLVEMETALHQTEDRFRVALQSVPLMVYTCDREQRYTWMYQPLHGFQMEDVLGKRDDEILPAQDALELVAVKQKALDSGVGSIQEVRVALRGEDTYYLLTIDPIRDRQGSVTGLICSAIDITEQKRLEAVQREQAIRFEVQQRLMDQRERERNTLARDLHDGPIQTLSAMMFTLAAMQQEYADERFQVDVERLRNDIKYSIYELRTLMNDLRPPVLLHFSFSKIVQYMTTEYETRFPKIKFGLDLANEDLDDLSETHRLALFRIYQAGMNNIIRHAGATRVHVLFRVEGDHFCFQLSDNGKGFEAGEDFARLAEEGHFGLIGMKERAEAIGSELEIRSNHNGGTTVRVTGPLRGGSLPVTGR